MIPSDLLLQYFHAAQCHLHDLQSSASSSTSYSAYTAMDSECGSGDDDDDDDDNDDCKNNMNNNLLSYHRNLIVQVQQFALDEVIEAWQKSQQERTEMVSDNNDSNFIVLVTRESVLSVLRQIGCDDYSSIIYVRGMTASSSCNNDEGTLMSLPLVDKEQQQQRTSITAAMEQTNEIARLVYTRLVLSSVAAAAATSSSSSSSSNSSSSDDVKRNDNSNSKDDDESPLDETTIYDYLALAMTAVRLPEVKQYLHYYNDGHSNADSISLLSFLYSTNSSMKCSQDDGVGQEVSSSSSQKHIINKKEQRLQYIQRLCWHAVLGVQSNIEHHNYAMNYVQYILEFEFGSGTVTGADKKKYDHSSQLLTTLAEYRTIMSTALIVDVTINITTSASSNLKGDGNEEEASSSTAAQREQLLLPSNECDDGTTRIVGVSYSEFIIDGGNSSSSNNDNNGVPKTNVINEHEIIRSRNEFYITQAARTLQQSIINDYNILSASQREETIVEATAVYNKLIIDMENVLSEKERVQLLQNMTTDEQRLLVIYKAIASNMIRNM